jgi:hypothetical protein
MRYKLQTGGEMKRRRLFPIGALLFMILVALTQDFVDTATLSAAEFEPLVGRWQRPDGGYILEIKSVSADGNAVVRYLNPRHINVSWAQATKGDSAFGIFVELRDAGYPGSTYTLVYEPKKDVLMGIYYQAAIGQRFNVVFVRTR